MRQAIIDDLWDEYKQFAKENLGTANISANLSASYFLAWLQKNLDKKD